MSALGRHLAVELCVLLIYTLAGAVLGSSQAWHAPAASPNKPGGQSPSASQSQPTAKPLFPSWQGKIAADASASRDLGDYVPCEFSRADLRNLRPWPEIYTVT